MHGFIRLVSYSIMNEKFNTELQDFISEHEAKKLLKRSTTWFWELRKAGFPYSKLKGENYYRKSDFVVHLERNMKGGNYE